MCRIVEGNSLKPLFEKGDSVRLRSRPDRSGVITATPSCISGQYWYPIFFGPEKVSRHPENDLEQDQLTTDVASIFRAQKFASRDAFTKLYTHLRLATSVRSPEFPEICNDVRE